MLGIFHLISYFYFNFQLLIVVISYYFLGWYSVSGVRQKPRILPYSCSCIWGTDFYGLWWFISGRTIYDVVVSAAAFILPSYWPSDSRKLSFLNRVWEWNVLGHQELIFSSQLVFCIPLIYLVFEQFWVALLFLDLLCEQDKQLFPEITQGREKDPGIISLRKSLPVVLCSLCFSST